MVDLDGGSSDFRGSICVELILFFRIVGLLAIFQTIVILVITRNIVDELGSIVLLEDLVQVSVVLTLALTTLGLAWAVSSHMSWSEASDTPLVRADDLHTLLDRSLEEDFASDDQVLILALGTEATGRRITFAQLVHLGVIVGLKLGLSLFRRLFLRANALVGLSIQNCTKRIDFGRALLGADCCLRFDA